MTTIFMCVTTMAWTARGNCVNASKSQKDTSRTCQTEDLSRGFSTQLIVLYELVGQRTDC
jgi:hypothetical protein